MLCKSKTCWAGIAFAFLTTGTLLQALPRSPVGSSDSNKEAVPPFLIQNEIKKMQETLRDKGHYRGKVDGVVGLRTRASIRAYQKAENNPVTGQVDAQTADGLRVRPESIWGNSKSTGGGWTGGKMKRSKPSAAVGRLKTGANKTSRK
jgi:peptidoglycan hydrolase-like protein with peptidoglycan-binding domain